MIITTHYATNLVVLSDKNCSKVHGVFPSTNSIPHLTKNSISLDPIRDSGEVVSHSCTSELTHKEFRYLRTLRVRPPLTGLFVVTLEAYRYIFFIVRLLGALYARRDVKSSV